MKRRPDCPAFEFKMDLHQNGTCQTDGHYLCANCRHITMFEDMEESDNRIRYYPEQETERLKEEQEQIELEINSYKQSQPE